MKVPDSLSGRLEIAKKRMIEEGAASYLEARVALNEFTSEVQRRCKEVLEGRLPKLKEAIKLELDGSQIRPIDWPSEPNLRWASLGVELQLRDRHLTLSVDLYWQSDEGEAASIWASATVSPWYKYQLDKAWPKFESWQAEKYEDRSGRGIYFSEVIPPGKVSVFRETLGNVLDKLIQAWKGAGGLKAFSE
jgi:hypothetical protein